MSEKFYDGVCADCKKNFEWSYFAQDVCNSCGIDRKEKSTVTEATVTEVAEVTEVATESQLVNHICHECGEIMWFESGKWWQGWKDKNGHSIKTDDGTDVAWWNAQPVTGVRIVNERRHEDRDDMGVFASTTGHSE